MPSEDVNTNFESSKSVAKFLPISRDSSYAVPLTAIVLAVAILYGYLRKKRSLPPGPPTIPFLGNYLSFPKSKSWFLFTSWSKKYVSAKSFALLAPLLEEVRWAGRISASLGNRISEERRTNFAQGGIYTYYDGRKPKIVISDPQIAFKLFTGRSNKYSSRPQSIVFERFSHGTSILTQPYGPSFAIRRKVLHQFLNTTAIHHYKERQEAEASRLVHQIAQDEGKQWLHAIRRFTASTIFSLSYGRRIDSLDSKVLKKRLGLIGYGGGLLVPGRYLVESIPMLNYLPPFIARWKIPVDKMAAINKEFDISLVRNVRQNIEDGNELKGSLVENMILAAQAGDEDLQHLAEDEHNFASIGASLFGAGSVTTISSFKNVVVAMLVHPRAFVAAQKEIDEVVGSSRSPNFTDKLHYLDALIKETLRWKSALPNGIDHATSLDDVYEGYWIPKGTTVAFNTWAMHQDPAYFPLAGDFAPERFLAETDERFQNELKGEIKFPGKHGHAGFGW